MRQFPWYNKLEKLFATYAFMLLPSIVSCRRKNNEMPKSYDFRFKGIYNPNTNTKNMYLRTAMVINQIIINKRTMKNAYYKIIINKVKKFAFESILWLWIKYDYLCRTQMIC